jgi:hypothetical protein
MGAYSNRSIGLCYLQASALIPQVIKTNLLITNGDATYITMKSQATGAETSSRKTESCLRHKFNIFAALLLPTNLPG